MGVTRVGDLLRLPRAGMARRFGRSAVLDIDIALARQDAPRRAFVPRERFCERCDFETEIETVAYLQKALEPLIGRCAKFLRERQAGVLALELRLRHRVRPATRVRLGLASITSEHRRLRDVLVQKLSRLELAAPILSMELLSGTLQPLSAGSLDAFAALGGAGGRDTAPQLVERLRARLGEAAVYGICSIPEHRPEAAWQRIHELRLEALRPGAPRPDFATRGEGRMIDPGRTDEGMPRPVWLLDEPVMLLASEVQQLASGQGDSRGRSRTDRKRLVGRQGYRPRLLHRAPNGRHTALGFSGAAVQVLVFARRIRLGRMYAELHASSNFTFLRGASQPEELVAQAKRLGYRALALTDECSLAGVVRAHVAAKRHALPLIIGTELNCADELKLVALATDRASYGAMSRLISRARRAGAKGSYTLERADLENALDGCLLVWLPRAGRAPLPQQIQDGRWLRERFAGRLWIGVELLTGGIDARRLALLEALGQTLELPRVAAGDVHMHRRGRRALQDVLTAIRLNIPLERAGSRVVSEWRAAFAAPAAFAADLSRAAARANARNRRALHLHAR